MLRKHPSITVYRSQLSGRKVTLTLQEFSERCGCHPELVDAFVRLGVVEPTGGKGEPIRFSASAVARVRRGLRLRHDLGVSARSLPLVLDLLERIDDLQAEIEELRKAASAAR